MAEYQISNLIDPKLDGELSALIKRLEECQKAFQPLMEEVRETYKAMGAGSKDVKAMIQAFEKYNDVMAKGASETTRYRTIQQEIEQVQKQLNAANKEQLKVLEDLKAKRQALIAEAKRELAQEAAEQLQKEKSIAATQNATAQRIKEQEQLRRTRQEIKRLIDMGNGELSTYRQKSATLARLREAYKDVADNGIKRGMLKEIQNLDRALKKEDAQLGVHTRNVGNYGRAFTTLIPGLSRFSTGFGAVGAGIVAAVAAFQKFNQAVRYGIQVNMEFEQANANLAAVLGTSTGNLQLMRQQAMELGRTTEYTAAQVTNAQIELAKLGFSEFSIRNMTEPLLGFATALDATLPAAAEVAGQALRAFNLSSTDTEEVLSLMTLAANKSAMDFGFLEKSIAIVGASASVAGVPLKDTLSLLGVLSNSGLDASRAATALRNIFLYLVDDSKKLGKELKGTEMNAEDIAKAFEELRKKGVDLADMFQLTDKRAVNALAVLIQNNGQIIELQNNIAATKGLLEQLRNTRLDTLQGDITLLKSAWDAFWLSFWDSIPIIRSTVQWITERLNDINENRKEKREDTPGTDTYATDAIDTVRIEASVKDATNKLRAAYDTYIKSLEGDDAELQKTLHQDYIQVADNLVTKYTSDIDFSIEQFRRFTDTVKNLNPKEYLIGKNGRKDSSELKSLKDDIADLVPVYEDVYDRLKNIRDAQNAINANNLIINDPNTSQETIDSKLRENKNHEDAIKIEREMIQQSLQSIGNVQRGVMEYGERMAGLFKDPETSPYKTVGETGLNVYQFIGQGFKDLMGDFFTSQEIAKAVSGTVEEFQRTNLFPTTGEYNLQSGKEKQAADQLADRQRNYDDKEELAAFNIRIEQLKKEAEAARQVAIDEEASYQTRTAAADIYIAKLQQINQLQSQRKDAKIRGEAIRADIGVTEQNQGDVPNPNKYDPVTLEPQTRVESVTENQRLAVLKEQQRKETELIQTHNKLLDKIEASSQKRALDSLQSFLNKREAEVEAMKQNELKKLDDLYSKGYIDRETYDEEAAKVELEFDQKMVYQMQDAYLTWLMNLDLPEELRQALNEVVADKMQEQATQAQQSQANLSAIQGRNEARKPQFSDKYGGGITSAISSIVSDTELDVVKDENGNIDSEGTKERAKTLKTVANVAATCCELLSN